MATKRVTIHCHAKVNLGLRVLGTRDDGYHDVRTVLQTIDLHDTLEVFESAKAGLDVVPEWAEGRGAEIPADGTNLVLRAAETLRDRLEGRSVGFRLVKRIPARSGLGGASSDAAATLMAIDRLFSLDLPAAELHRRSASLGADVPFFLYGGAGLGLGRGDEVYPLPDAPEMHLAIVFSGEGLSTPDVYRAWDGLLTSPDNVCRISDFAPWCLVLRGESPHVANDLEDAALALNPALKEVRRTLEATGAGAVSMTGSGSAFFGICGSREEAVRAVRDLRRAGHAALAAKSLGREERDRRLWSASA